MSIKATCVTRRLFSIRSLLFVLLLICAAGVYLRTGHTLATAAPTTFKVNSLADTNDGVCDVKNCTLREAINAANANVGADTIDFSVTGTINLTGALSNITEDVTINGPGAGLLTVRRNTGGAYRIFTVLTPGIVTFFGLTISNGSAVWPGPVDPGVGYAAEGGGIDNISGGTVNVTSCVLSNNSASIPPYIGTGGGISNRSGTLNVTNSILSGNFVDGPGSVGGAICNAGTLNITDSTLVGNYIKFPQTWGGGIWSGGTAKITNSTISGNSAETGGGISSGGVQSSGTMNVINSTITGNTAVVGGGIGAAYCTLNVTNSTISDNYAAKGGGIDFDKGNWPLTVLVTLKSTIVALNTAPSFPDLHGAIISHGYNIIGATSGSTIVATTGDQFGITAAQLKLGPLGNNGGPTQTMGLELGSVAIDQGINSNSLATDQRGPGFARTYDDPAVTNATGSKGTDVGAFEAVKPGIPSICDTQPWVCQGLCQIPCPPCSAGCLYEIIFEELVDPWRAVLLDPIGNPVRVQQMKRGNQVTMRFRVNERFADKLGEYTVVFKGGKPGTKPAARFQVNAIH